MSSSEKAPEVVEAALAAETEEEEEADNSALSTAAIATPIDGVSYQSNAPSSIE